MTALLDHSPSPTGHQADSYFDILSYHPDNHNLIITSTEINMTLACGRIILTGACLKLCYHKCIKMFFGFKRSDSVTQILLQLGLPSLNTLIHNSRAIFLRTWTNCPNMPVSHLRQLGLCF